MLLCLSNLLACLSLFLRRLLLSLQQLSILHPRLGRSIVLLDSPLSSSNPIHVLVSLFLVSLSPILATLNLPFLPLGLLVCIWLALSSMSLQSAGWTIIYSNLSPISISLSRIFTRLVVLKVSVSSLVFNLHLLNITLRLILRHWACI